RFLRSPGLTPLTTRRTRTSPGPGSGSGTSPSSSTSRGAPCFSYHAARTGYTLGDRGKVTDRDVGHVAQRRVALVVVPLVRADRIGGVAGRAGEHVRAEVRRGRTGTEPEPVAHHPQ